MNRTEMIHELLERFETELDELSNGQLTSLLAEYEHIPMLTSLVENLADEDDDDKEDDEDEDKDELPLIDGDWSEDTDEE